MIGCGIHGKLRQTETVEGRQYGWEIFQDFKPECCYVRLLSTSLPIASEGLKMLTPEREKGEREWDGHSWGAEAVVEGPSMIEELLLPNVPCNDSQSWAMTGRERGTVEMETRLQGREQIGWRSQLLLCWLTVYKTFNTLNLHTGWGKGWWRVTVGKREQRSTIYTSGLWSLAR